MKTHRNGSTQGGAGDGSATTEAALSASAPTFGRNQYTGLFVEVTGESDTELEQGVAACEFLTTETPVPYEISLIDRSNERNPDTESTILYTAENNDDIQQGVYFVISQSQSCSDEYLTVGLEGVDEESTGGDVGPGTGDEAEPGA